MLAGGLGVLVLGLALMAARKRRFGIAQVLGASALVAIAIPLYMKGQHVAASALAIAGEAVLLIAAWRWTNSDLSRVAAITCFAFMRHRPIVRMCRASPASPSASIAAGVPAARNSGPVARLTLRSVACAERITATSSSNGVEYSSSVRGSGLSARSREKNSCR